MLGLLKKMRTFKTYGDIYLAILVLATIPLALVTFAALNVALATLVAFAILVNFATFDRRRAAHFARLATLVDCVLFLELRHNILLRTLACAVQAHVVAALF